MKATRRRHDAPFKARVALEALKATKTVQQIAKEFDLHPVQVSEWKKVMQDRAANVFERGAASASAGADEFDAERTALHSKIGELTIKVDFLTKKSRQLGL